MANKNCLVGMKCPQCGSEEPFGISVTAWACCVTDDGTEDITDVEWDDDSACVCKACGYSGTVSNFKIENQTA